MPDGLVVFLSAGFRMVSLGRGSDRHLAVSRLDVLVHVENVVRVVLALDLHQPRIA